MSPDRGQGPDGRNGAFEDDPDEDDELDELDAAPLDEAEATSGAARAGEPVAGTLAELVDGAVADLEGVERRATPEGEELLRDGRPFAALHGGEVLEVALPGPVARAALATPDTGASTRGSGWVRFAPQTMDRFAADRVEAWIGVAYRRAGERGG